MKFIFIFFACWPLWAAPQTGNQGIQWTKGFGWEQVKAKAKEENKYILVDCYATWCAPCKRMDKEIFVLDSVAEYVNAAFVPVKVQMDVTDRDNDEIKKWYPDVEQIRKQFRIRAYPTYLFFTPEGILVQKVEGYFPSGDFLSIARMARLPGQIYDDPLARYDRLMKEYEQGIKRFDSMYYMYKIAVAEGHKANTRSLKNDLNSHLGSLLKDQLFTPERLEYMQSVTNEATDKWFPVFHRQTKRVNRVMKDKNYAQRVVDRIILEQIAWPFLKMPPPGMLMMGSGIKADLAEGDWDRLEKKIRKSYGAYYARRNTLAAQMVWYRQHWNVTPFLNTYFKYLDQYGLESHELTTGGWVNDFSYAIVFMTISDPRILDKAIKWMKKVVESEPYFHNFDTYAGLLYKDGRKQDGIFWEERAWQDANTKQYARKNIFKVVLEKMKKGEKLDWTN